MLAEEQRMTKGISGTGGTLYAHIICSMFMQLAVYREKQRGTILYSNTPKDFQAGDCCYYQLLNPQALFHESPMTRYRS
jgi:hypothetical protein